MIYQRNDMVVKLSLKKSKQHEYWAVHEDTTYYKVWMTGCMTMQKKLIPIYRPTRICQIPLTNEKLWNYKSSKFLIYSAVRCSIFDRE